MMPEDYIDAIARAERLSKGSIPKIETPAVSRREMLSPDELLVRLGEVEAKLEQKIKLLEQCESDRENYLAQLMAGGNK